MAGLFFLLPLHAAAQAVVMDVGGARVSITAPAVTAANITSGGGALMTEAQLQRLRDWLTTSDAPCASPECAIAAPGTRYIKFFPYDLADVCFAPGSQGACPTNFTCDATGACSQSTWNAADAGCAGPCKHTDVLYGFGPYTIDDFCYTNLTNPGGTTCPPAEACSVQGECRRLHVLLFKGFTLSTGGAPMPDQCNVDGAREGSVTGHLLTDLGVVAPSGFKYARCGESFDGTTASPLWSALPPEVVGAPEPDINYIVLSGAPVGGPDALVRPVGTSAFLLAGQIVPDGQGTVGTGLLLAGCTGTGDAATADPDDVGPCDVTVPSTCDGWAQETFWATPPHSAIPCATTVTMTQSDTAVPGWVGGDTVRPCNEYGYRSLCWGAVQFADTWDAVTDLGCDPRCVHTPTLAQDLPPSVSDMCYTAPNAGATACPTGQACGTNGRCGSLDIAVFGTPFGNQYAFVDRADADAFCAAQAAALLDPEIAALVTEDPTLPAGNGGWHASLCTAAAGGLAFPPLFDTYGYAASAIRMASPGPNDFMRGFGGRINLRDSLTTGGWLTAGGGEMDIISEPTGGYAGANFYTGCLDDGTPDAVNDCNDWAGGAFPVSFSDGAQIRAGWLGGTVDPVCNDSPEHALLCAAPVVVPWCSPFGGGLPSACDNPKFMCDRNYGQCRQYFWDAQEDFGCDPGCVFETRVMGFDTQLSDMCYTDWQPHDCDDGRVCSSTGWSYNGGVAGQCTLATTLVFLSETRVANAADLAGASSLDDFCTQEAARPGSITRGLMDAGYIVTARGSPFDGWRAMRCQWTWPEIPQWPPGAIGMQGSGPVMMFGSTWNARTTDGALSIIGDGGPQSLLRAEFPLYDQFGVERGHEVPAWVGCASRPPAYDAGLSPSVSADQTTKNMCNDWTSAADFDWGELSSTGSPVENHNSYSGAGPWWLGALRHGTRAQTCDTPGYRRLCWAPLNPATFPVCEDADCGPGERCGPLHTCVPYYGRNCQDTATGTAECDGSPAVTVDAFAPTVREACLPSGSSGSCPPSSYCNTLGQCQGACTLDSECTAVDSRMRCNAGICQQWEWDAFEDFGCAGDCVSAATATGFGLALADLCYTWTDARHCEAVVPGADDHRWCDDYGRCNGPPTTYLVVQPATSPLAPFDGAMDNALGSVEPGFECELIGRSGAASGPLDVVQWYHAAAWARRSEVAESDPCMFRNIPDESPYKANPTLIDYFHPTIYRNANGALLGRSMFNIFGNCFGGGFCTGGASLPLLDADGAPANGAIWTGTYPSIKTHASPSTDNDLPTCGSTLSTANRCWTPGGLSWSDATNGELGSIAKPLLGGGLTDSYWTYSGSTETCDGPSATTRWACWGMDRSGSSKLLYYDWQDWGCDQECDRPGVYTATAGVPPVSASQVCYVAGEPGTCPVGQTCQFGGHCV